MIQKFIVMGVSGCGKSQIGVGFAAAIDATFIDADDLHPESNVAKMAAGTPLTDADRAPWLADVGRAFVSQTGACVIGCSALKRRYRDVIRACAQEPVMFLHLHGDKDVIAARMGARDDHFMPTMLLDSQFETLELLQPDETYVTVDIDQTPKALIAELVANVRKETL